MAGRNVAPNLSGMFQQINEGIASDKTASIYTDNFKRSMAPAIDMDDSESILAYSQWAKRNGYDDEAKQYMALGYKQRETETANKKEANRAKIAGAAGKISSSTNALAGAGDTAALTLNRKSLEQQLDAAIAAGDSGLVQDVTAKLTALSTAMPTAVSAKAKKGAEAIDKYRGWLSDMSEEDPRKPKLEKALAYLEADPETAAAYRDLQKEKMSVESAENAIQLQEDQLEENAYDITRRPYAERVESLQIATAEYRLQETMMSVDTAQRVAQDKQYEQDAKSLVQGMVQRGYFDPAKIPENIEPTIRAYAVGFLDKERAAKEQADVFAATNAKRVLTPYYYNQASLAAYVDPAAEEPEVKNAKIAQLLQEYDRIMSGDTMMPGELAEITGRIVGAIKERDAIQLKAIGNTDIPSAKALTGFRNMKDTKGLFEANSFHSLMDDSLKGQERYIEMQKALAGYMADNGIETFNNVTELYSAMEDIAPTLSDPAWSKASNTLDIRRKQGIQKFNRQMNQRESAFVESYVAEQIADDPGRAEFTDVIEDQAREVYDEKLTQVYDFFTTDNRWWMTNKGGLERDPETGIRLTPQMRMIMNAQDGGEWDTVKKMVGDEIAATIEARVMAGIPFNFEDLIIGEKKK